MQPTLMPKTNVWEYYYGCLATTKSEGKAAWALPRGKRETEITEGEVRLRAVASKP